MKYTLTVLVENKPGVLSKVVSLFARRGYNIDSLAVGVSEDPAVSRMTIVGEGDESIIEQVEKQLNKIIPVIKVRRLGTSSSPDFVSSELMLVRVDNRNVSEINAIVDLMKAEVVKVTKSCLTIKFAGEQEKCETLCTLLKPYGVREISRTGVIAME